MLYYNLLNKMAHNPSPPEIIFGAGGAGGLSAEEVRETLGVLQRHGVKALDTAFVYV